jgi:transcriptional regulator with PAS, ATPase and Fis domain
VGIANVSTYDASDAFRPAVLSHGDPDLLQAMVDGSPDGLCLLSPDRALLMANRAALDLLGGQLDPEGGPDGTLFDWSIVERAATSRQAIHREGIASDGRRLLATARPTFSPDGAVSFVVLTLRDLVPIGSALPALDPAGGEACWAGPAAHAERPGRPTDLIARSPAMAVARDKARQFAAVDSPVLLHGETGTGKRILARAIHDASGRREGPFMEVSAAAVREALLDAELFGQVGSEGPGGGASPRVGLIELAHRGTVLVTEVGDLPPALQVKLLRFMDDGEVWPVGAAEPRRPDVRVLVSSTRDLGRLVAEGLFRADLYYRLNVLTLMVPPLRDRREDIGPLVEMMVAHLARLRGGARMIAPTAIEAIARGAFPGNVRELWSLVDRLVSSTSAEVVNVRDLPPEIGQSAGGSSDGGRRVSMRRMLRELEAQMVRDALARYGTQTEAAKHLGVTQSTVARKAKQYGLGRR